VAEQKNREARILGLNDSGQRTHIRDDFIESSRFRKTDRSIRIAVRSAVTAVIISEDDEPRFCKLPRKMVIAPDMLGVTMRNLDSRSWMQPIFRRPFQREYFRAIS
jgi:hypothetical protein